MLSIEQLRVRRGELVLHYDFQVKHGEIVALVGRSGVGKSTLLLAIAGFEPPASGDIRWNNQSLLHKTIEQRPVALLFQEHNLFEHLSVERNLQLGLHFASRRLQNQKISEALSRLELVGVQHKMPSQLYGGQRERIALIRTLLRAEPLILLDEPFTGLDVTTRHLALAWVCEQIHTTGKTAMVVTHHTEDVERLGARCVQLD